MTHPIIQSIIEGKKHIDGAYRAAYEAGYVFGKDLLKQVRREIAELYLDETLAVPDSIYGTGWQDAMGDMLEIIDKVITATEGLGSD